MPHPRDHDDAPDPAARADRADRAARADRAVAKLQALVRIPTVSHRDPALVDTAAFDAFLVELERQFPLVHERLATHPHRRPRPAASTGPGAAASARSC